MTRLVRKLDKKIWIDKEVAKGQGWLEEGLVCADALKNFRTVDNKLSVFRLANDEFLSRIISAIVASPRAQSVPDTTDYVVFDQSVIEELGIQTETTLGDTLDEEVNRLHLDLTRLSADRLVRLAEKLQACGQLGRFAKRDIANVLRKQISEGVLSESILPAQLVSSISKYGS